METSKSQFIVRRNEQHYQIESYEPCLVCGAPTQLLHLQVNACRACAAFFRRSIHIHKSYRCQKNKENCDVTMKTIGKPLCRLCRYKKCLEVGMKLSRGANEVKIEETNQIEKQVVNSQKELLSPEAKKNIIIIDFSKIFQTLNQILCTSMPIVEKKSIQNYTKEFSLLLTNFNETFKPQSQQLTNVINEMDNKIRIDFLEKYFLEIAKLLNNFEPFANLQLFEKHLLHKKFWQTFYILDRCFQTCQFFGNDLNDSRVIIDYIHFYELDQIKTNNETKIKSSEVFIYPFLNKIQSVFQTFKKMNLTLFEFSYICQIALWSCFDITELSPSIQNLADEMLNKTSKEMHDYFIHELRMPYYATRQSQLFRIVYFTEVIVRLKDQLLTGKEIFNFGDCAFGYCDFELGYYKFINKSK